MNPFDAIGSAWDAYWDEPDAELPPVPVWHNEDGTVELAPGVEAPRENNPLIPDFLEDSVEDAAAAAADAARRAYEDGLALANRGVDLVDDATDRAADGLPRTVAGGVFAAGAALGLTAIGLYVAAKVF